MRLEDYLEFLNTDRGDYIRVQGTRVGLDVIVEEFHKGTTPDRIQQAYPTVTLEQVYGTIAYYLHNQEEVDEYIRQDREARQAAYEEWRKTHKPSPVEQRLHELRGRAGGKEQP